MQKHRVRALLMGGAGLRGCTGAAEFGRDADFAIVASPVNLSRLRAALVELRAEVIAVPPFELKRRGHAIHFRCFAPEVAGLMIDVMTKMRGVEAFPTLWQRRVTVQATDGTSYQLMSLPDLVKAKKTQRDKDWPMIRRLLEADYFKNREQSEPRCLRFWLLELRTPELLIEVASAHSELCRKLLKQRSLLKFAVSRNETTLIEALATEEKAERDADRQYWTPLKAELEQLRLARLRTV